MPTTYQTAWSPSRTGPSPDISDSGIDDLENDIAEHQPDDAGDQHRGERSPCWRVDGVGRGHGDTQPSSTIESPGVGPEQAAEEARGSTEAEDHQAEHHGADEGTPLIGISHAAHPFAPSDPASVSIETTRLHGGESMRCTREVRDERWFTSRSWWIPTLRAPGG